MNLIYGIGDKPKFKDLIVFSFQQLLAIIAATIVVPIIVNASGVQNLNLDPAAALFGAGVGTLVYVFFTKKKSPVFLGSSFAFLSSINLPNPKVNTIDPANRRMDIGFEIHPNISLT